MSWRELWIVWQMNFWGGINSFFLPNSFFNLLFAFIFPFVILQLQVLYMPFLVTCNSWSLWLFAFPFASTDQSRLLSHAILSNCWLELFQSKIRGENHWEFLLHAKKWGKTINSIDCQTESSRGIVGIHATLLYYGVELSFFSLPTGHHFCLLSCDRLSLFVVRY